MSRDAQMNLRLSAEESAMLEALAAHEERTMSDTVRRLVRHAYVASGLTLVKSPKRARS